jgi:hypothetical protein
MSESVRVSITVSKQVHRFLRARAALTGSTVAGSAADIVISAMVEECDRIFKVIPLPEETDDHGDSTQDGEN